jgi:hypothetical protein
MIGETATLKAAWKSCQAGCLYSIETLKAKLASNDAGDKRALMNP